MKSAGMAELVEAAFVMASEELRNLGRASCDVAANKSDGNYQVFDQCHGALDALYIRNKAIIRYNMHE